MVEERGGTHFLTVIPIRETGVFVPLILLILPQPPNQLGKLVIKTHDQTSDSRGNLGKVGELRKQICRLCSENRCHPHASE